MPISDARKRANQAYIDKQDEIKIRVPKGRKAEIQAHAEAMGESLNGFVGRAIKEAMERDSSGPEKEQKQERPHQSHIGNGGGFFRLRLCT